MNEIEIIKKIRNNGYIPFIQEEGVFVKDMPTPPGLSDDKLWYEDLKPSDRMFFHQTLNSARRFAGFKPYPKIPQCSLDLALSANYEHNYELFAEKVDVVLQQETVGKETFRRIRNTRELSPERIIPIGHPLQVGGIKQRKDPNNIKLMNSGHHTHLTNHGYSRQDGDGNYFRY